MCPRWFCLIFLRPSIVICHDRLCCRLERQFGFGPAVSGLFRSYLRVRRQVVSVGDERSSLMSVGVPQGSILSPVLI
jgi:hypothetical protein